MLIEELLAGLQVLEGDQFVASVLESGEDLSSESSVDGIRLQHDEGSLLVGRVHF